MKKVIIFSSVILLLFVALGVVTFYSNKKEIEGNPFKKSELHPVTKEQLEDPNYQNIILPDELEQKLKDKEDVFVYFYQSNCPGCQATSPTVVPAAEEIGVDLKLYNLLEFEKGWNQYKIKSTPTFVYFKDGKEVDRLVPTNTLLTEEEFKAWLEKNRE